MGKFLRNFGMGLVYIFLLPLLLIILAIGAIYCLCTWFYHACVLIYRFFRGQNGFEELKEDQLLKEKLEAKKEEDTPKPQEETKNAAPQQVFVQQNFYQMPPGYIPPNGINTAPLPPFPNPQVIEETTSPLENIPSIEQKEENNEDESSIKQISLMDEEENENE